MCVRVYARACERACIRAPARFRPMRARALVFLARALRVEVRDRLQLHAQLLPLRRHLPREHFLRRRAVGGQPRRVLPPAALQQAPELREGPRRDDVLASALVFAAFAASSRNFSNKRCSNNWSFSCSCLVPSFETILPFSSAEPFKHHKSVEINDGSGIIAFIR